jgi:hypothetical protein
MQACQDCTAPNAGIMFWQNSIVTFTAVLGSDCSGCSQDRPSGIAVSSQVGCIHCIEVNSV